MTAQPLPAEPIRGRGVVLVPIPASDEAAAEAVLRALYPVVGVPEVFAGFFAGGPKALPDTEDGWVAFLRGWLPAFTQEGCESYAVHLLDESAGDGVGELVGMTSLGHLNRARELVEIGWTAYSPKVWGGMVNPACKLALLEACFERGYEKVILNVDNQNARSLRAVAKLGATREGVLRRDRPRPDGTWRDTVTHAILKDVEWPTVRANLEARLAAAPA